MWWEKVLLWASMLERSVLYPLIFISAVTEVSKYNEIQVHITIWYVGRIPVPIFKSQLVPMKLGSLPSQVSPFRLFKSYYPSSGACCVQVPVWYVGRIPGDDHLPCQISPSAFLNHITLL
jgi:hypothetical protein